MLADDGRRTAGTEVRVMGEDPGPWKTRRIGPFVTRYRRRRHPDFVAFDQAVGEFRDWWLSVPPGSWIVRFVWWLNGKLGGPRRPGD